jgi:Sec-independent protein translocase protein TatA
MRIMAELGGKKLPELGGGLAKGISEFKKAVGGDKAGESQNQIGDREADLSGVKVAKPAE